MAKTTNKYKRWEPQINLVLHLAVELNTVFFRFRALKLYLQIPDRFFVKHCFNQDWLCIPLKRNSRFAFNTTDVWEWKTGIGVHCVVNGIALLYHKSHPWRKGYRSSINLQLGFAVFQYSRRQCHCMWLGLTCRTHLQVKILCQTCCFL